MPISRNANGGRHSQPRPDASSGMPGPAVKGGMPGPNGNTGMPRANPSAQRDSMPDSMTGRHAMPGSRPQPSSYGNNGMPRGNGMGMPDSNLDPYENETPQHGGNQFSRYSDDPYNHGQDSHVNQNRDGRDYDPYQTQVGGPASSNNGVTRQDPGMDQGYDYGEHDSFMDKESVMDDLDPMGMDDDSAFNVDDDADYSAGLADELSQTSSGSAMSNGMGSGPHGSQDMRDAVPFEIPKEDAEYLKDRARTAEAKRQDDDNQKIRHGRKSRLNAGNEKKKQDAASKARTVRITVITVLVLILCIGFWNVLMPKHQWSAEEISSISKTANGDTGFPMQEGAGIAQQFIQAYLQSDDDSSAAILDVFYNGTTMNDVKGANASSSLNNLQTPSQIRQVIKAGPYLYDESPTSTDGDAATYKFGALVYRVDKKSNQPILVPGKNTPDYKWLFYQVDVHYDKKDNKFSIAKNSPTRVPEPRTSNATVIPQYQLPGNGQEDSSLTTDEMQKLITTFFKAWAASDQTALVNITDDKLSQPSVYEGLNGEVVIDGNGEPSYKIYGPPSTDGYYRALVTVNWRENVGSGDNAGAYTQTSTYVLKLKKQSNGKFIVVDVQPYKYIPEKNSDGSSEDEETSASNDSDSSSSSE